MADSRGKIFALALAFSGTLSSPVHSTVLEGYIGGTSNQISSDVPDVPGNRFFSDLFLDFDESDSRIPKRFTLSGRYNDEGLLMYSLQEAYIGHNISDTKVFAGRKVLHWAKVDSEWGLGKLNNRENFDFFRPGQEGLVGLNVLRNPKEGFRLHAFISPAFVPELNPALDIDKKNRTVTSRNPWADPPADSAEVEGSEKPIQYYIDNPDLGKIVYNWSAGLQLGWSTRSWALSGFYIRKPENQISTNVSVTYNTGDDLIKAFVTPRVFHHDVFGGEIRFESADVEAWLSSIGIRPNAFPTGSEEASQFTEIKTIKRREDYVSAGIGKNNDKYGMALSYIARLSPFDPEGVSLAVHPRWNQALGFKLRRAFTRTLAFSGDFKYDTLTLDRLLMIEGLYKFSPWGQLHVGANMIGTSARRNSFWRPYSNNDSIYSSIRYLF